jgi:hypothetical protein
MELLSQTVLKLETVNKQQKSVEFSRYFGQQLLLIKKQLFLRQEEIFFAEDQSKMLGHKLIFQNVLLKNVTRKRRLHQTSLDILRTGNWFYQFY